MKTSKIDVALGDAFRVVGEACEEKSRCCEDAVRRSPLLAVACAATVGYLLQVLPLSRLVGGIIRLTLSLLKPALLIYGTAKVVEYVRESCPCASKSAPRPKTDGKTPVEIP